MDKFEAEHMDPEGQVLVRDKQVSSKGMRILSFIGPLAFLIGTIALGVSAMTAPAAAAGGLWAATAGALLLSVVFGVLTAAMLVLRTVVTDRELLIRCGLWGPRVPIGKIKSCRVDTQRNRLRIGKRYENGMWTSAFLMRLGDFVEVVFTDESGKDRRVQFTPQDPQRVAEAIQQARGSLATGLRVEGGEAQLDEGALDEEAEAEGEAESSAGGKR